MGAPRGPRLAAPVLFQSIAFTALFGRAALHVGTRNATLGWFPSAAGGMSCIRPIGPYLFWNSWLAMQQYIMSPVVSTRIWPQILGQKNRLKPPAVLECLCVA